MITNWRHIFFWIPLRLKNCGIFFFIFSTIETAAFPFFVCIVIAKQVAALVSRLEKTVPKANADRPQSPPLSKNLDRAPEPLREVMASAVAAAEAAAASSTSESNGLPRNASSHMGGTIGGDGVKGAPTQPPMLGTLPSIDSSCGGSVRGACRVDSSGACNGSSRGADAACNGGGSTAAATPAKKFETIAVTPVRPLPSAGSATASPASPARGSGGGEEGGDVNGAPPGGKSAHDVLGDVAACEEIFGKAFRGGPQAAAGLAARLQREVCYSTCSFSFGRGGGGDTRGRREGVLFFPICHFQHLGYHHPSSLREIEGTTTNTGGFDYV